MARSYVTLSPDLVEYADVAVGYLNSRGYRVSVEVGNLYYPNTPTLMGKKGATEFIIEVAGTVGSVKYLEWLHYGRARGKETYVAVVLPPVATVSADELAKLRAAGMGVCTASATDISMLVQAVDLSTAIWTPDLGSEKAGLRKLLRPAFQKIADGAVVDGFKDAAGAFENLARSHLQKGVASTRIKLVTRAGKARSLTAAQIAKLTLGQLGVAYGEIVAPTQADDLTRRAIASFLQDRNDATHEGGKPAVVRRVKKNTPRHVFAILNAMRELL
jgi:hypothetical protein